MTITKLNKTTLMVEMKKEEIPKLAPKELAYHILNIAISAENIETKNCAFLLEGTETKSGAVFLLTIRCVPKRYRIKKRGECAIYAFQSLDDFLDCIKKVYKAKSPVPESSTYIMNDMYYLVFSNSVIRKASKVLISEFGKEMSKSSRLHYILKEHGHLLTKSNSVELIGSTLL